MSGTLVQKIEIILQINLGAESNRIVHHIVNHRIFYFSHKHKKIKKLVIRNSSIFHP